MKKSFLGLVWGSLLRVNILVAILLTIVLWILSPAEKISMKLALPVGAVFLILIMTLGNAAYESFRLSKHTLPRVLHGRKPSARDQQREKVICLLEPSELFSYDALVSFYHIGEENFEQLIGLGNVLNIQEDGRIQVVMIHALDGYDETVQKLAQNDAELLKKIRIKPYFPKAYLDPGIFNKIFYGGEQWTQ